jgi:Holliday junction resolvasome RuvABC DNA-binding subunit
LCCAHHRAIHRGQLIVEGRMSTGLVFRHSDGTAYGQALRPGVVAIREEAFRALRSLGFRESEARRALERLRATSHVDAPTIQTILRQALALLVAT